MSATLYPAQLLRRNLSPRRLLSFPHLVVGLWVLVILWGERWVFYSRVKSCEWRSWEQWPEGARPHHLVFVADPQLIDPHSYPGRPWPINPLTILITDNYLRRSYNQLQRQLHPDTLFFLGDLFDGGREWKPAHGEFEDPSWGQRPKGEQKWAEAWKKQYGQAFWLEEYARFGDIFFKPWNDAGEHASPGQRGRRLIASLPGNHDLGFGAEVKLNIRERFECYFGEGNRVDVIGNHTFVSIDAVSMSADTSDLAGQEAIQKIYKPTEQFLDNVTQLKQSAVARELRYLNGMVEEARYVHKIEELDKADFSNMPKAGGRKGQADLPTILLSHVPLYRPPGTPCGPKREHWPPTKPPKGQQGPVTPDHRNAISVTRGYQYQNVLAEQDSIKLVKKIGNIIHAFSGDDHDYCEVTHDAAQGNVPEITVKSFSMAMGVPTPGFVMMSMYNPIDELGNPLPGAPEKTIQTHLCLLPAQLSTFARYGAFAFLTIIVLVVRAALVPVLKLQPFAGESSSRPASSVLPVFKEKVDDYDHHSRSHDTGSSYGFKSSSSHSDTRHHKNRHGGGKWGWASPADNKQRHHHQHHHHSPARSSGGPKIEIRGEDDDEFYDSGGGRWRSARRRGGFGGAGSWSVGAMVREVWTTVWRVVWISVLFWAYLNYKG